MENSVTDHYAVMGNPIAHSKSPFIHARFAEQTGQTLRYDAILVERDGFPAAVAEFIAGGGRGLNITVPFKQEAWSLAARRSDRAQRAGAVNTLRVEADGTLFGDNTDGIGLVRDIGINHGVAMAGKRLLVLGAGGAVRGVPAPLLAERPAPPNVVNRTAAKAEKWVAQYGGNSAPTPKAAAQGQDFVMACVGNDNDLRQVMWSMTTRVHAERDVVMIPNTRVFALDNVSPIAPPGDNPFSRLGTKWLIDATMPAVTHPEARDRFTRAMPKNFDSVKLEDFLPPELLK